MRVVEQEVPAPAWHSRCGEVVGSGARMLDFLTAVDDPDGGRIDVVVHLVDVEARVRHLVRTWVPRESPVVDSLTDLLSGAGWHEREVHEMFGVAFRGNPDLRPLLTTGDMGRPLLRTTALPARMSTPWPGAFDPSDRPAPDAGRSAARPRTRPPAPGIPAQWRDEEQRGDRHPPTPGPGTAGGSA